MLEYVVREVKTVTVDPKSGETRLVLEPKGVGMALTVSLSRAQAEELCDKLYDGFCALLARDDKISIGMDRFEGLPVGARRMWVDLPY